MSISHIYYIIYNTIKTLLINKNKKRKGQHIHTKKWKCSPLQTLSKTPKNKGRKETAKIVKEQYNI